MSIIQGDALTVLKTMGSESIDCCITSPPYWGLRDYGTAKWEGGDADCSHRIDRFARKVTEKTNRDITEALSLAGEFVGINESCPKCGAIRKDSQLGLEKTPEEYVAKMVGVFREVKRVLKSKGTLWLNLGDTYATPKEGNTQGTSTSGLNYTDPDKDLADLRAGKFSKKLPPGLKPKDLVGIPWRVAFALQADGWYLRQDIIWAKPNPMPESVIDRCTKSHEYVFLLSKSSRYYFDNESIKEKTLTFDNSDRDRDKTRLNNVPGRTRMAGLKTNHYELKNKRSVWKVATHPFSEAHFATFPEELITPMIKAGCPKGGLVLDPFAGAGTTGVVCKKLGRKSIGIELNPEYIKIAEKRLRGVNPIL